MIGWLRRLFAGEPDCRHEYEIDTKQEYRVNTDCGSVYWKTVYHLRCKKCGWVCQRVL